MTDRHERDSAIEQLLRKELRSVESDSAEACPDAEIVAAWAEGGLSKAESASAQAHLAGCARCQAMLAAFVRADVRPVPERRKDTARGWLPWLAPAAVAATGIFAVWAFQTRGPGQVPTGSASGAVEEARQMADARDQIAPFADAVAPDLPTAPAPSETRQKSEPSRRAEPSSSLLEQAREPSAAASDQRADAAGDVSAQAPASPPPPDAAPTPAAAGLSAANAAESTRTMAFSRRAEAVVTSADPQVRWRIVGGRDVERSIDGGASWQAIPTGVDVELATGASPARDVCWLIGRNGLVLLTTDGRTWSRLPVPATADLTSIRAADAERASVTTADGRVFSTTTGGRTWTPGPLQGF